MSAQISSVDSPTSASSFGIGMSGGDGGTGRSAAGSIVSVDNGMIGKMGTSLYDIDMDYLQVMSKKQSHIRETLLVKHSDKMHSYNKYFIKGFEFYDSQTSNYSLYNIFNDFKKELETLMGKNEPGQQSVQILGDESVEKEVGLVVNVAGNESTDSNSADNTVYTSQFAKPRHTYIMSLVYRAIEGINGLLNGNGGSIWFGIDEETFIINGIHLLPSEMYFVERAIHQAVNNFTIDNYDELREQDIDKQKENEKKENAGLIGMDGIEVDKFVGLKATDFMASSPIIDIEEEVDEKRSLLTSLADYAVEEADDEVGTLISVGSDDDKRNNNEKVISMKKVGEDILSNVDLVDVEFIPIINEEGVLLNNWFVMRCNVNNKTFETIKNHRKIEFINGIDDKIYIKYMTYMINKLPNCRFYEKNYYIIYEENGKPKEPQSRLHKITLDSHE